MDKRILKGLIDEKLEVIQEQFSIIRDYDSKIPMIEVDLLMTSIRDLYELVINLQQENMGGVQPQAVSKKEAKEPKQEPEVQIDDAPLKEETQVSETDAPATFSSGILSMERVIDEEPLKVETPESPEPVTPDPEPIIPESSPDEPVPPVAESQDSDQEADHDPAHEEHQRLTADLFSEGASSMLADRLKEGQEKRVADKLQENIIVDLRTTIGINDKFLFINELFEGNMSVYDEVIQKLNSSTTMAQTDLLLLDLKIDHNWDSESSTVKKFVELVRRKF